jgi:predicted small metal-binding protein
MAKVLKCREVGLDCNFVARADTEEEIMQQIADHANTTHGVQNMPEDVVARVRGVIHDVGAWQRPLPADLLRPGIDAPDAR